MTVPGGLNSLCMGVQKTYATISATRTKAGMTISNGGRTVFYNGGAGSWFLDMDKTSGIWSMEVVLDDGWSAISMPGTAGMTTSLNQSQYGNLNYSSAGFPVGNGSVRTNNVATAFVSDTSTVGNTTLVLFDFDNRKRGCVKAGSPVWSAALGTTEQLYVFGYFDTSVAHPCQITINTGQTPFSAANKTILAGISGANEGIWK